MARPDLELRLVELGDHVAFPPTPDLARSVGRRLRQPSRLLQRWRWAAALAAALVLATLAILAASPGARQAVAGFLGLPGFEVHKVEKLPTPTPASGARRQVSLTEARRLVAFQVLAPPSTQVMSVWYDPTAPGGEVELDLSDGSVLTEFQGSLDQGTFGKLVGPGTTVAPVTVNGQPGYWFSGTSHFFFYKDPGGDLRQLDLVKGGNVLVWKQGGVLLRLEGAPGQERAIEEAGTLR